MLEEVHDRKSSQECQGQLSQDKESQSGISRLMWGQTVIRATQIINQIQKPGLILIDPQSLVPSLHSTTSVQLRGFLGSVSDLNLFRPEERLSLPKRHTFFLQHKCLAYPSFALLCQSSSLICKRKCFLRINLYIWQTQISKLLPLKTMSIKVQVISIKDIQAVIPQHKKLY